MGAWQKRGGIFEGVWYAQCTLCKTLMASSGPQLQRQLAYNYCLGASGQDCHK